MSQIGSRRKLRYAAVVLALAALTVGVTYETDPEPPFHDFLAMMPGDYHALVDPYDEEVKRAARRFKRYEDAHDWVRDGIRYAGAAPACKPGETLRLGYASCLGKAALLCSIYRAMGMDEFSVRVVTGIVSTPEGLTEHAWLDLEVDGICYQQDPSGLLGSFAYAQWPGQSFIDAYVVKEIMIFNDEDFGIVSQLNRMRGRGH